MFGLVGRWRRNRLAKQAFPEAWEAILDECVPFLGRIPEAEQEDFRTHLKVFAWEKKWFGAHGLEVTDHMKVVVAAGAARMSRNLSLHTWSQLGSIIIYPDTFAPPGDERGTLGQATRLGSVILSWDSVKHGIQVPNDGHDVTLHEFAHVLDLNGDNVFDGVPDLRGDIAYGQWAYVLGRYYDRLVAGKTRANVLRDYGGTNPAEFFAVATEAFFEKPILLRRTKPDLYHILKKFYRVDPAKKISR